MCKSQHLQSRSLRGARLLRAAFFLGFVATAAVAHADGGGDSATTQATVQRLLEAKRTLKWNRQLDGQRYGHAETLVGASADKLLSTVEDFGHYRDLHPKFSTARVIGKEQNQTDVYMQYPVKIGLVRIRMYEVMRFGADSLRDGAHVINARGTKGDMEHAHTVITVTPVDAGHALLQVDVLLVPKLPAPQFMIDEELRDGAEDFVNGLKDRAQGWVGPVVAL